MEESADWPSFDEERQRLAKRYQQQAVLQGLAGLALFSALAFLVLPSGVSLRLESWTRLVSENSWVIVGIYVLVAYLSLSLLSLPLRVIGRRSDLRYGLTKESWTSWAAGRLRSLALSLLLTVASVEVLYWSIRSFGSLWWLVLWVAGVGITVVAGYLSPIVLLPLFYKVRKVVDGGLVEKLKALALKAGVQVIGVYEFESSPKTERGTAALAGMGRTRRILLSDHMLKGYSDDEVEGILAHELAHHVQRDTAVYFLLSASASLLALLLCDLFVRNTMPYFGISSLSQVSNLPLFALFGVLFYTATGPVSRWVSRRREARADRLGAKLCGNSRGLASALVKLHNQNLSDASPNLLMELFFYTHPPGRKRLEALRSLAGEE